MHKKTALLSLLFITIVLVGCTQQEKKVAADILTAPTEIVKLASTNYIPYTKTAADKAEADGKKVAVFFHSTTCGSCAALNKDIEANLGGFPEDVVVLKAEWDEVEDLATEYDVEKYHTVTFLSDTGNKNVGGLFTLEDLLTHFDNDANDLSKNNTIKLASTNYIPYSKTAADKAEADGKKVAVFFHSVTCGSCAALNKDIEANLEDFPEDVVVLKAEWEEVEDLAAEYDVEKYHTVTFLGDVENKNVKGLFTLEELLSNFEV